jgi:Protein of unknown function (DUF2950)
MTGGFGLVAFATRYGVLGVMTFVVNQDGVVYQKDLGPNTARLAVAMRRVNPTRVGRSRKPTTDERYRLRRKLAPVR